MDQFIYRVPNSKIISNSSPVIYNFVFGRGTGIAIASLAKKKFESNEGAIRISQERQEYETYHPV